ncbi:uncharacterized protein ndufv3 [Carcharodon carcharias]|uniref:uncharacterized protein ndufv3 n=1 Tax=Carcharodon carcharias TaxID=13397 RepID=UPI001B7E1234|nr:uncharacterized protein ndufv3 [Carcharodon carcharias]
MAMLALGLGVRGLRQVLMERPGLQAMTLTTKATGPQKKKKVRGAEAAEIRNRDCRIQTSEITSTERANLLSKKTVLLFPRKDPGPMPLLGERLWSAQSIPEGGEKSVAANYSHAISEPVADKSVAEEESSSSSDSSSDSDEETVTEYVVKTPVEFPKRDPASCTQYRGAEWTRGREEAYRGELVRKPQEVSGDVKVLVSKNSAPSELGKGEEKGAQAAHLESTTHGSPVLSSSEICAGAITPVTKPGASSPPKAKSITQDTTVSSSPKEWVLPAQDETPDPEHVSAQKGTPEPTAPALAETTQESVRKPFQESAEESVEVEVLDTSSYKNTQHHDYTPLTFVDLDVEMAKYRLPQPSSGRMSPRH